MEHLTVAAMEPQLRHRSQHHHLRLQIELLICVLGCLRRRLLLIYGLQHRLLLIVDLGELQHRLLMVCGLRGPRGWSPTLSLTRRLPS